MQTSPVTALPRWHDATVEALRAPPSCLFPISQPLQSDDSKTQLATRGEGVYVSYEDGIRLFETCSSMFNVTLGYSCEPVKRAIREQLDALPYMNVHKGNATSLSLHLARMLCHLLQNEGMSRVFFNSGGSEAMDTAMKMCRHYWDVSGKGSKKRFASFSQCFHGMTYGAASLVHVAALKRRTGPYFDSIAVTMPDMYRREEASVEEAWRKALVTIEEELVSAGTDTIAALFFDPFGWPSGLQMLPAAFWQGVRQMCDRLEILIVADEIVTGFGRTGTWFACQQHGITPDMLVVSKGITAGYFPFGAVLLQKKLEWAFSNKKNLMVHGHTNSGQPVGCAAAIAAIEYVEDFDVIRNVRERGEQLRAQLRVLQRHCPVMGDVRGRGVLNCIEFVQDKQSKRAMKGEDCASLWVEMRSQGLKLRIGRDHEVVLCPASVVTEAEITEMVTGIAKALAVRGLMEGLPVNAIGATLMQAARLAPQDAYGPEPAQTLPPLPHWHDATVEALRAPPSCLFPISQPLQSDDSKTQLATRGEGVYISCTPPHPSSPKPHHLTPLHRTSSHPCTTLHAHTSVHPT
jgi:adenosylmethionine-8-amino-7-oxononanoate aminotransferase